MLFLFSELPKFVLRGLVAMWKVVVAYSDKHPEIEQQQQKDVLNKRTVFDLIVQKMIAEFQRFGDDAREEERWLQFKKVHNKIVVVCFFCFFELHCIELFILKMKKKTCFSKEKLMLNMLCVIDPQTCSKRFRD